MHFAFTEEQEELRSQAHGFLGEFSAPEQVRKDMESEMGYDPELWGRISAELGWTSVVIPEEYGGLGLSYVELIALMEEMGAALLCAPFLSSVCLAGSALILGGTEDQKQEHLPGIAEGTTIGTLAYMESNGRPDASGIETVARRDGGDFILTGAKSFVLDGHTAGLLVVAARRADSSGEEGISLFVVPSDSPGLERRLLPTMDQTRKQAELALHDVRLPASALMGEEGEGWKTLSGALDLAAVALAAEQVGGAQRCLDMSVAIRQRARAVRPADRIVPGDQAQVRRHDGRGRIGPLRQLLRGLGGIRGHRGSPGGGRARQGLLLRYLLPLRSPEPPDPRRGRFHLGIRRPPLLQARQSPPRSSSAPRRTIARGLPSTWVSRRPGHLGSCAQERADARRAGAGGEGGHRHRWGKAHLHYGDEEGIARVAAMVPLGRLGEPRDVGNVCLFLASPLASYVTGANLLVHGGGEKPAYLEAAAKASGSSSRTV